MQRDSIGSRNSTDEYSCAQELLHRAQDGIAKRRKKKIKRVIGLSNFLVNSPYLYKEEEIQLFIKAAEAFRICNKWIDASAAYGRAAWILGHELKQQEEGAILYTEAGLCAMRLGIEEGKKYFQQAVSFYCNKGDYYQAGRVRCWIANQYEEANRIKEAIEEYRLCVKYFEAAKIDTQVLHCEQKVGRMLAESGCYTEAAHTYKSVGFKQLRYNLTKYNASESFFYSSILLFSGAMKSGSQFDFEAVYDNIKVIIQKDFRFEVSASCDFLYNIMNVLKNSKNTLDDFIDHLYDYNVLYPLEPWCLDIMEKVMTHRFHNVDDAAVV